MSNCDLNTSHASQPVFKQPKQKNLRHIIAKVQEPAFAPAVGVPCVLLAPADVVLSSSMLLLATRTAAAYLPPCPFCARSLEHRLFHEESRRAYSHDRQAEPAL